MHFWLIRIELVSLCRERDWCRTLQALMAAWVLQLRWNGKHHAAGVSSCSHLLWTPKNSWAVFAFELTSHLCWQHQNIQCLIYSWQGRGVTVWFTSFILTAQESPLLSGDAVCLIPLYWGNKGPGSLPALYRLVILSWQQFYLQPSVEPAHKNPLILQELFW